MKTQLTTVSRLQVPTWNWLKINDTQLRVETDAAMPYTVSPIKKCPEEVKISKIIPMDISQNNAENSLKDLSNDRLNKAMSQSIIEETATYVEEFANHCLHVTVPDGVQLKEPVVLEYVMDEKNERLVNQLHIFIGKDSSAEIVVKYSGSSQAPSFHFGYVTIEAAKNARLQYTGMQMLDERSTHVDGIAANVSEGASLTLLLAEFGARQAVAGADVRLSGRGANAELDSLYAAGGDAKRDLNYRLEFAAEETEGMILARGVLAGSSRKTMKSTIDFKRGATRAKGREEESVLVLSDQVANVSAPLLLCGEDNVEGKHATSIGRPDKEKLYYLQSRGFTEKQARRLLVEGLLTPLLAKVGQNELRQELTDAVREVVYGD